MGSRLNALRSLRTSVILHQQDNMTLKMSHKERTAADCREPGMHTVVLDKIEQVNNNIRLLELRPRGEKPKARDLSIEATPELISNLYSTVPPRPVARCSRSRYTSSRWLHDHIYA